MSQTPAENVSSQIAAERAIAELRFARPVLVNGATRLIVWPAEQDSLPQAVGALKHIKISLLLSAARLNHLQQPLKADAKLKVLSSEISNAARLAFDETAAITQSLAALSAQEASALQLVRFAKFLPAAFIAEISPTADVKHLNLFSLSENDIAHYQPFNAACIKIAARAKVPLADAHAEFVTFSGTGLAQHLAVIVGTPDLNSAVLTRLHSACLTGDLFGSLKCDCGDQLRSAVQTMAKQGGGILLYLDQEGRGHGLTNKLRAYDLQAQGMNTFEADTALGFRGDARDFDIGAAMLKLLGASNIALMTNNPAKVEALQKAGLNVAAQPLIGRITKDNLHYLETKRDKAHHIMPARLALPDA